jgi:hypothetical protein
VKIVAAINARKTPIEAGLVFMMTRTIFGEDTLSIRSYDRMQIGPEIRLDILDDNWAIFSLAVNRNGTGRFILLQTQADRTGEQSPFFRGPLRITSVQNDYGQKVIERHSVHRWRFDTVR